MVYKYGFEVARSHAHAMQLDAKNGNKKWKEAVNTELSQIVEYETFEDITLCSLSSITVTTRNDM